MLLLFSAVWFVGGLCLLELPPLPHHESPARPPDAFLVMQEDTIDVSVIVKDGRSELKLQSAEVRVTDEGRGWLSASSVTGSRDSLFKVAKMKGADIEWEASIIGPTPLHLAACRLSGGQLDLSSGRVSLRDVRIEFSSLTP